jgi:hypothetical protein
LSRERVYRIESPSFGSVALQAAVAIRAGIGRIRLSRQRHQDGQREH